MRLVEEILRKLQRFCRDAVTSAQAGITFVVIMLLVAISSIAFPSQASAFDCATTTGPVDKAICGSESLRKPCLASDLYFADCRRRWRHQLLIDSQRGG